MRLNQFDDPLLDRGPNGSGGERTATVERRGDFQVEWLAPARIDDGHRPGDRPQNPFAVAFESRTAEEPGDFVERTLRRR